MSTRNTVDVTEAIERAKFGSLQFLILALCAWIALLDGFDTQAIAYVAPVIAEQWGIPMAGFGPIFGAGLAGLTVGAFVLSPAADRFGRKSVILLSVLLFGIFALITAKATTLNQLLIFRFPTGLGLGGAMPNIIALTSEYAPKRMRAVLIAVMFCGFPLGSTIGGVVSAPLISSFGWQSVFVVAGSCHCSPWLRSSFGCPSPSVIWLHAALQTSELRAWSPSLIRPSPRTKRAATSSMVHELSAFQLRSFSRKGVRR